MKNKHIEKRLYPIRQRLNLRRKARMDEKPDAWITLENGQHIPLNKAGKAIGGAGGFAKGKDFSKANTEKEGSSTSKGKQNVLYAPSKATANRRIKEILDKGKTTRRTWDQNTHDIAEVLKELEAGTVVTVPEHWGDPGFTLTKQKNGKWKHSVFGAGFEGEIVATYFAGPFEKERAYVSKSPRTSRKDPVYNSSKSIMDQESPWKKDKPLFEMMEITLHKKDLQNAGPGIEVKDKEGNKYKSLGNGIYRNLGTGKIVDGDDIKGATTEEEFFGVYLGLNGALPKNVGVIRDGFAKMSKGQKKVYEKTFREKPIVMEKKSSVAFFNPETEDVHFGRDQLTPEAFFHEMTHALEKGSVSIKVNDTVTVDKPSAALDYRVGEEGRMQDFETIASKIGFATDKRGWFKDKGEENSLWMTYGAWQIDALMEDAGSLKMIPGADMISDAISAYTKNRINPDPQHCVTASGHPSSYWDRPYGGNMSSSQSKEYFANYCTMRILGYNKALNILKELTPNMYRETEKIFDEVFKDE